MESKLDTMAANESAAVKALKAHLSRNVRNVEQSIEFYRKLLGIERVKVRTGYAKFDLHNPPLNLPLNEAPITGRGALSHLGIQVASTDDVLAMKQKWSDAGLFFSRRDANELLLRDSGQDLGARSGWQRMGSICRAQRQPS